MIRAHRYRSGRFSYALAVRYRTNSELSLMKRSAHLLLPSWAIVFCAMLEAQAPRLIGVGGGPPGGQVETIALDPSNPTILYVGTRSSGVFKSRSAGTTWASASSGLTEAWIRKI